MSGEIVVGIGLIVAVVTLWNIAENVRRLTDNVDTIRRMLNEHFPDPDDAETDDDESDDLP